MSEYNFVVINWAGRAKRAGLSFLIVNLSVPWTLPINQCSRGIVLNVCCSSSLKGTGTDGCYSQYPVLLMCGLAISHMLSAVFQRIRDTEPTVTVLRERSHITLTLLPPYASNRKDKATPVITNVLVDPLYKNITQVILITAPRFYFKQQCICDQCQTTAVMLLGRKQNQPGQNIRKINYVTHGRRKVEAGEQGHSFDFEIWHFLIKLLAKKGCFLNFERLK